MSQQPTPVPADPGRAFKEGDRVTWSMAAGGYGFVVPVAGIVRKVGRSRVRIEVAQKVAGEWVRVLKQVSPAKLTHRARPVPELGEGTAE